MRQSLVATRPARSLCVRPVAAMSARTYYDVLNVPRGASPGELKSAFRSLARTTHPDAGGSSQRFQEARHAYEVLSHPSRRLVYDQALAANCSPSPSRSRSPSSNSRATRSARQAVKAASAEAEALRLLQKVSVESLEEEEQDSCVWECAESDAWCLSRCAALQQAKAEAAKPKPLTGLFWWHQLRK